MDEKFEVIMQEYGISEDDPNAKELLSFLKAQKITSDKPKFTDMGLEILEYLQNSGTTNHKAKDIAEGMMLPARKISGAMRKLVTDGYVEKYGQSPVVYNLTEQGINFNIQDYKENLEEK